MEHAIAQYVALPLSKANTPTPADPPLESPHRTNRYKNLPKTGVAMRFFCIPVTDFK